MLYERLIEVKGKKRVTKILKINFYSELIFLTAASNCEVVKTNNLVVFRSAGWVSTIIPESQSYKSPFRSYFHCGVQFRSSEKRGRIGERPVNLFASKKKRISRSFAGKLTCPKFVPKNADRPLIISNG